jgi:chlorobactene glucosyltransferase
MEYVLIFVSVVLVVISLQAVLNVLIMPRLKVYKKLQEAPFVSVLIPARNEVNVIADTVRSILVQNYPNYEVILLDDNSSDGTGEIATLVAQDIERFKVIQGTSLPTGWAGKNWACQQLAQHAKGDILVFTDADTRWQPDALNALITQMHHAKVDLYTVWSSQKTVTWSERLIVPLMAFVILSYLPIIMTHFSPFSVFAAANGQCMAWRRKAYEKVGGHATVANNVLDDVTLAREAKKRGLSLRMADGNYLINCRMYQNWAEVRNGFAKNILSGYGNSVIILLIATLFHWVIFLLPFLWFFNEQTRLWGICCILLAMITRALTAKFTHQNIWDALLMPISVLIMTRIAFHAIYWRFRGGVQWKGRTISQSNPQPSV